MMKFSQSFLAVVASLALQPLSAAPPASDFAWHALDADDVSGKGWTDTAAPFDRLPGRAESLVRSAVWQLSRDAAGLSVDFSTNATRVAVKWTVTEPSLAMPHMAATGKSGVDLYQRQGEQWQFAGTARPAASPANEVELASGLAEGTKQFRLYFPLYNGVSAMEIGVPAGAELAISPPASVAKAIVFYGTSILQGGCASRPGMAYPSILGRRLGMPIINLGFSGNGKCEPEVAKLVAELDPTLFVLDPLPNLLPDQASKRLPAFIDTIRAARPQTPILLVASPRYADAPVKPERAQRVEAANAVVDQVYRRRVENGEDRIFLAPGLDYSAAGGEVTVDGTHPTDLGFTLMAEALEPHLRRALQPPP